LTIKGKRGRLGVEGQRGGYFPQKRKKISKKMGKMEKTFANRQKKQAGAEDEGLVKTFFVAAGHRVREKKNRIRSWEQLHLEGEREQRGAEPKRGV